jgi:hypothetical protein
MSSEYAVLPYTRDSSGAMRFFGSISYLGPEAVNLLDGCLNARLSAAGYSAERDFPAANGSQGIAVLKRAGSVNPISLRK